jgi:hypothetical protein
MGYIDGLHPIAFRGGMGAIPQPEPPEMPSSVDPAYVALFNQNMQRISEEAYGNEIRQDLFRNIDVRIDRRADVFATQLSIRWMLPSGSALQYSNQIAQEEIVQGQDYLARTLIEVARRAARELTELFLRESINHLALRGHTTTFLVEGLEASIRTSMSRILQFPLYGRSPSQEAMDAQRRLAQLRMEQSINAPMIVSTDPGAINYTMHLGAVRMRSPFGFGDDEVELKPKKSNLKQYKPAKFKLSDAPIIKEVMPGLMQVPKEDINERVLQIMGEKK